MYSLMPGHTALLFAIMHLYNFLFCLFSLFLSIPFIDFFLLLSGIICQVRVIVGDSGLLLCLCDIFHMLVNSLVC